MFWKPLQRNSSLWKLIARRVSKCGVISGLCFPVFGLNTGKYRPEINPYLDTFHAVRVATQNCSMTSLHTRSDFTAEVSAKMSPYFIAYLGGAVLDVYLVFEVPLTIVGIELWASCLQ